MCNSDQFEKMRAEAHAYMKGKETTAIRRWLHDMQYDKTVGYARNVADRTFIVYTEHPGWLIGLHGQGIYILKDILKQEFGETYEVTIIEVRGGFVDPQV